MTNVPEEPDLVAIAREAEVEIVAAEAMQVEEATGDDAEGALGTAELGYYEAELKSLRDAATALDEAEHGPR
jgi:hypothetical protein